jgi:hypothetical protein
MRTAISIEEGVFDRSSIIINFDGLGDDGMPSHHGGYMRVTRDDDCQCFNIIIFNKHGDVVTETNVLFDFDPIEEE